MGKRKLKRPAPKGLNFNHKEKGYSEIVLWNQRVDQYKRCLGIKHLFSMLICQWARVNPWIHNSSKHCWSNNTIGFHRKIMSKYCRRDIIFHSISQQLQLLILCKLIFQYIQRLLFSGKAVLKEKSHSCHNLLSKSSNIVTPNYCCQSQGTTQRSILSKGICHLRNGKGTGSS